MPTSLDEVEELDTATTTDSQVAELIDTDGDETTSQSCTAAGIAVSELVTEMTEPKQAPRKSVAAQEREEIFEALEPSKLKLSQVDWVIFGWMALMHVGALASLFFFTWQAAVATLVLHWLTCSIGICMTYHRSLSHGSLVLKGPAKIMGLMAAGIAGEGPPLTWTAVHRIHHSRSDKHGDPHSPIVGGPWWSHLNWMFLKRSDRVNSLIAKHYVPDLSKDKMISFFERTMPFWLIAPVIVAGIVGWATGIGALSMALWAGCLRLVLAYHSTWFVNSATHLWGYRNYKTTDESRNLWWVAVLAYGEGWHNNHHAHPRLARAGHRWWEFDATWQVIKLLRAIGLAEKVDDRVPQVDAISTEHDTGGVPS